MSAARARFVDRAALLRLVCGDPDLSPKPPAEKEWNERARLIKASLCIGSLTALEEFFQARIKELVAKLTGTPPGSKGLPTGIRVALVQGALEALYIRIRDAKRFAVADPHSLIVAQSAKIASFMSAGLDPSDLALATNGSNLSWAVVETALAAFGVENPSSVVNGVAKRLEGGIFVAKDHFESVLEWRHKAAHVPDADIPLGDVRIFVEKLVLLAASIDIVLSTAVKRVLDAKFGIAPPTTKSGDIRVRFVDSASGKWRDIPEGGKRAKSLHADQIQAFNASETLAKNRDECVVLRLSGATSLTASWSTPFV